MQMNFQGRKLIGLLGAVLVIGCVVAGWRVVAQKQDAAKPKAKQQYIIRLQRAHPERDETKEEQELIARHFQHVKSHYQAGRILVAGLSTDDWKGILILETDSPEEAQAILDNDPAVKAKVFLGELHPFRVVLLSGR